jgi:hypothetical protein
MQEAQKQCNNHDKQDETVQRQSKRFGKHVTCIYTVYCSYEYKQYKSNATSWLKVL